MAQEGYSKVAGIMSEHPEFAIFRRFSKLNLQNILHLQAELTDMEQDLEKLANEDKADPRREQYAHDWRMMRYVNSEEGDQEQMQMMLKIREKIKEYSKLTIFEALLGFVQQYIYKSSGRVFLSAIKSV